MSRAQTLVLALLVMNFLMGFLCLAAARGERASPALRMWGMGLLLYASGLLLTQQRYLPPALLQVAVFAGNALIAWAPVWCVRAALAYSPRQIPAAVIVALLGATIALLALNNFWWRSSLLNFVIPSPIAIITFGAGAVMLWRGLPEDAARAGRFLAVSMLFAVVVWVLRIGFLMGMMGLETSREAADLIVALFAIAQLTLSVASAMAIFWVEVQRMEAALTRVAFSDALTGLPNRRATTARFQEEAARAERSGQPLSLVVIDLDHFKRVNDSYGHLAGDAVLKHASNTLTHATRPGDVLGRIGGEEFVLLLPGQGSTDAQATAERLRERLAAAVCDYQGQRLRVTLSAGVATLGADGSDWDQLFGTADARCYRSKQSGRNRVTGTATPD
jgi:diguanylate cyclase (GGDEF)-like protein